MVNLPSGPRSRQAIFRSRGILPAGGPHYDGMLGDVRGGEREPRGTPSGVGGFSRALNTARSSAPSSAALTHALQARSKAGTPLPAGAATYPVFCVVLLMLV